MTTVSVNVVWWHKRPMTDGGSTLIALYSVPLCCGLFFDWHLDCKDNVHPAFVFSTFQTLIRTLTDKAKLVFHLYHLSLQLLAFRCLTQTNPRHFVLGAAYPRGPWGSWEREREREREASVCCCVCGLAQYPWGSTVKLSSAVVSGICSLSLRERERALAVTLGNNCL